MIDNIFAIPTLNDNYVWTIVAPQGHRALIVDPGEAEPVLTALAQYKLQLDGILVTHRHWDHVNGIPSIQAQFQCPVYGPNHEAVPQVTRPLAEGDQITFWGCATFTVWATPGHTTEHISYLLPDDDGLRLFCGDTLFAAGCGRLLGGTAKQLHNSLNHIATLPGDTQVHCTHEYTQANLRFAAAVEPANAHIKKRLQSVENKRNNGEITLPTTIFEESLSNPFLRCEEATVAESVERWCGHALNDSEQVFTELRRWKDVF